MADLSNNNQLPPPTNPNTPSAEQTASGEESEPVLNSLTQEVQAVFERAATPFELNRQFNQFKTKNTSKDKTFNV